MKTGDFHALNTLVTDTVNDALREADFQANLSREATEKKVWNSQRSWQDKSGRKSRPRRRSRRNGSSGKAAGRAPQTERGMAQAAQRAGKAVGRTAEGAGSREPCTESGTAGDTQKATAAEMTSLVKMEKKGNVSGTLCTVFGGIGLGFSGLGLLVQLLLAAFRQHL